MLDQFFSHETLEDFVEAPDWKPEEKLFLRITAVSRGLKAAATVYCDEQIHVISRKYDLSQVREDSLSLEFISLTSPSSLVLTLERLYRVVVIHSARLDASNFWSVAYF